MRGVIIATIMSLPFCMHGQGVVINRGAYMIINGDARLVLQDAGFINNGNFTAGKSTVMFTAVELNNNAFVGGSASSAFNNFVIKRPSGVVQLQNNISVSGKLVMQGGNLELNRYRLDLGHSGTIEGENSDSYITGNNGGIIVSTTELNAPGELNPGNIGITLSSTANFGVTTITRGHAQQVNARGEQSIKRYYEINPSLNSNATVDVRFHYLQSELSNINEPDLVVWSGTNGGTAWTATGKERADNINDWIEKKGLEVMNRFTLGVTNARSFTFPKANTASRSLRTQTFIQVYPNPVRDRFTLVISVEQEYQGTVALQDATGRVLELKQVNYQPGLNTIQWNIGKYASGTYYVVLSNAGSANVKIIKQ